MPSPNPITLGAGASTEELGGDTSQFITQTHLVSIFQNSHLRVFLQIYWIRFPVLHNPTPQMCVYVYAWQGVDIANQCWGKYSQQC